MLDNNWQKSSKSANNGQCVEVRHQLGLDLIQVRHSKDPDGPQLDFTPAEWLAFTDGVKGGEFDLPPYLQAAIAH